jgi:gamma-polyglutamate biosynthesis protein CapA
VSFGDHPLCTGFGAHSRFRSEPPAFAFELVKPIFDDVDLLFGNCECTLSQVGLKLWNYQSAQMRGQPAYASGLSEAGFAIVNVANNHSQQHGLAAFEDSVALLKSNGIQVCGLNLTDHRHALPIVVTRNGVNVVFLAYSLRPRQYFDCRPSYAEGNREAILDDVKASRRSGDSVVVSLHWGDEFIDFPSAEEVSLAHDIVDAGADLVLGHHPHVLRTLEGYGRGYIMYSLGNFVCDMLWDERMRESVILRCNLSDGGASEVELVPVRIGDDYRPAPLCGEAAKALRARFQGPPPTECELSTKSQMGGSEDYASLALAALRDERRKAHRYFLRNLNRFPIRILLQQMATYFRNRVLEVASGLSTGGRGRV